jgi:hypothetical protein
MPTGNPHKHIRRKRKTTPDVDLEEFPYARMFAGFLRKIKRLEADCDTVNHIPRQYISTFMLWDDYRNCFGAAALASNSIAYRIRQLSEEEFPDDFIILENDTRRWEAKYFVNRLNIELLKRIYLPGIPQEIRLLAEMIQKEDEKFRPPIGLMDWVDEEDWDIRWE